MQIAARTFFLIATVGTVLSVVLLVFFGYVFLLSSWSASVKIIVVIVTVAGFSLLLNWYQARAVSLLQYRLKTTGHGDEELFSDLYQNSPVPYLRTDRDGRIIHANAAAVRFFRQTKDALVAVNVFSMIDSSGEDAEHPGVGVAQLVQVGHFVNEVEAHFVLPDGAMRWAQLSAFPYARSRERLITLVDITEEKAVDIAKSEFVSLASHQLRTPISAMLWNLELMQQLQSPAASDQEREYLKKIVRSAERMNLLIDGFLDAAKLEMGTFASKVSTFELNDFLSAIMEEFEAKISQKSLQASVVALPQPLSVTLDKQLLHIVFSNLVSNAVKYTPDNGRVHVELVYTGNLLVFKVADSGIGVPTDDQEKIFSKLYRATNTKTSGTEGTGLGLYVVKQAVDMLGGTIEFTSAEGQGTTFTVRVPYQA